MSAQVRLGYKLTEAGVIPDDWEAVQLQNICTLVNGRGFKPHEWENSGLPIIRIQNLNGSNEFNYYSGRYDQKILVESEQLLFAWSGSRGTSFGPHVWKGGTALLNYHTWKIVINESKINARYFFYALKDLTACIEKDAHGASALVHTQKCEMEKYYVRVPPIELQQKIANYLSDMDELINGLDQLIAKKRDIKQAVTQQLLTGRQRLPGFCGEW
jgi:type I restriction enzyme S subunit